MGNTKQTTTVATTTSDDIRPSQKFADTPRLWSVTEIAHRYNLSPATVTSAVMTSVAPEPDFIAGERMFWTDESIAGAWSDWIIARRAEAERKAAERIEREAKALEKLAERVSGSSAKTKLLEKLVAGMSASERAKFLASIS